MTNKQDNIILNSLINNIIEFILKHKKKILIILGVFFAPFLFTLILICIYKFISIFIEDPFTVGIVQFMIMFVWLMFLVINWFDIKRWYG